jgi:predicted nucleotidyltransferase component of viral defense system
MEYNINDWVADAPQDNSTFRKAVHIILTAISSSEYLKPKMIMKGGILLAIRYKSSRFTTDIDFSTAEKLADIDPKTFENELNESLKITGTELTYRVVCKIQSIKIQPKKDSENATFPSFNLTIGYASLDNHPILKRLNSGNCPHTIKIDYSLNEMTYNTDEIVLEGSNSVSAYCFTDLIAEKIRSIIQQPYRNRNRRQDVYDLNHILTSAKAVDDEEKLLILKSLINKSKGRVPIEDIHCNTLDRSDIITMSKSDYHLLKDEVLGELPLFEDSYQTLVKFYKSLPWDYK